jgi:Xaa-Pro dipeptidase
VIDRSERLALGGLAAVVLVAPSSIAYCCGFRPTPFERLIALVITREREMRLVVPSLEEEAAAAAVPSAVRCISWRDEDGPVAALGAALAGASGRIGVEYDRLTLAQAELVRAAAGGAELADCAEIVTAARIRKEAEELAALRRSCAILDEAMTRVASEIRPGVSELALSGECGRLVRELGGDTGGFDPLVLTGPRSALPHGKPGATALAEGDLVIVDFGAAYSGYYSDATRTFVAGRKPDERQLELMAVVRTAELAGIAAARPGVPARDVDRAARAVIDDAGYGEYFIHRTGHGLGLDVHEPPWLTSADAAPLDTDMIVTVEPGIYLPGYGGVRIEDDVRVDDPPEVLTHMAVPYLGEHDGPA